MKIDCSITKNFLEEYGRLCNSFDTCHNGCPLKSDGQCRAYVTENPEKSIQKIQKWSDDNPPFVTLLDKFLENYPSKEADNFNVVRQLTVINCISNDVLFQMTGKMSITADTEYDQLEVVVEDNGAYKKHFIGLSDNVAYVVEDLGGNNVDQYNYTLNFNPKM